MLSQIIVAVWYSYSMEHLKCIPKEGRFYRKPLDSKEPGDVRYGQHPVGVNSLSKYLKTMCTIAKINMDGRRFTNHSGKVTCATQLYESGQFDEQTIMARTGHRSSAVRAYKRPSSTLTKAVSNALQPPADIDVIKHVKMEDKKTENSGTPEKRGSMVVLEHGETRLTLTLN